MRLLRFRCSSCGLEMILETRPEKCVSCGSSQIVREGWRQKARAGENSQSLKESGKG